MAQALQLAHNQRRRSSIRTEIRYLYDEDLATRASRRFLSRYFRNWWLVVVIAAMLLVVALILKEWTLAAIAAAAGGALIIAMARYRRRARRLAKMLKAPEITVTADDEGLEFAMPHQRSKAGWTPAREVWMFDDVWIFLAFGAASQAYTAVPTQAMTQEFRDIVLENMHKQGARVR